MSVFNRHVSVLIHRWWFQWMFTVNNSCGSLQVRLHHKTTHIPEPVSPLVLTESWLYCLLPMPFLAIGWHGIAAPLSECHSLYPTSRSGICLVGHGCWMWLGQMGGLGSVIVTWYWHSSCCKAPGHRCSGLHDPAPSPACPTHCHRMFAHALSGWGAFLHAWSALGFNGVMWRFILFGLLTK